MFESKYNKLLTVLLIIIIVAIVGLIGYLGYNYFSNYKTSTEAEKFVASYTDDEDKIKPSESSEEEFKIEDAIEYDTSSTGTVGNKKKQYKGYNVIGTIQIPKTNVNYPILEDPPTVKKLEKSVTALYPQGAVLNTPGNVVIVGHNYRNGLFFSNNKKLSVGDKINITDLEENKVTYVIYNIFQTEENDTSFYNRDTDGAKEITLSTCTDDSKARLIIEAKAD